MFKVFHSGLSIAPNAIACQGEIALGAYLLDLATEHHLMMLTPQKIGWAIDRLRQDRRLTKKALAELCDIDPGNLNRIISGQQEATLSRMEALSKGLSVQVSDIYRMAEGGQPPATDPRKAALHVLIEHLDPDQLDVAFRRMPVSPPKREEAPAIPDSIAE